jgi:hypothetical protein
MTTQSRKFVIAMYSGMDFRAFREADLSKLGIRPETQQAQFASFPRYLQVDMDKPGEEQFVDLVVDDVKNFNATSIYVVIKRLAEGSQNTQAEDQGEQKSQETKAQETPAEKKQQPIQAKDKQQLTDAKKKPEPAIKEEQPAEKDPEEKPVEENAQEEPDQEKPQHKQEQVHRASPSSEQPSAKRISATKEDLLKQLEELQARYIVVLSRNDVLSKELESRIDIITEALEERYARGMGKLMVLNAKNPEASLREALGLIISERLFF